MLSRAQNTNVREKLKEKVLVSTILLVADNIIDKLPTIQSLLIQTIKVKIKYRIITRKNKEFYDFSAIF